MHNDVET